MKNSTYSSIAPASAVTNRPHEVVDEAPRFSRRDTLLTMLGVLLVMLLASLDQTIVGTAMPRIISELQGFERYTWVTTAYLWVSVTVLRARLHRLGGRSRMGGRDRSEEAL